MRIKDLVNIIKKDHPAIYRQVFAKRYTAVERFCDYRKALFDYAALLVMFKQNTLPNIQQVQERCVAYAIAKELDFPLFFVHPGLLEAVMATKADLELNPATMHLPFESFSFVLPLNKLRYNEQVIEVIDVFRVREKQEYKLPGETVIVGGNTALMLRAKASNGEDYLKTLIEPFNPAHLQPSKDLSPYDPFCLPVTRSDSEFLETLTNVVFNLLCAMQARPELVESGHRISHHRKTNTAIWSPNVIGRKYAIKKDGEVHGAHASPQMHWRRGHFRQQPYGVGRTETKIIWLEPCLVGVKNAMLTALSEVEK